MQLCVIGAKYRCFFKRMTPKAVVLGSLCNSGNCRMIDLGLRFSQKSYYSLYLP